LDVNEYQNIKTVQMIVKEISPSAEVIAERKKQRELYRLIIEKANNGQPQPLLSRDDVASVYSMIKSELNKKHEVFSIHALLHLCAAYGIRIDYVKLRLILDIFSELNLLGAHIPDDEYEIYRFKPDAPGTKTQLGLSILYRMISRE